MPETGTRHDPAPAFRFTVRFDNLPPGRYDLHIWHERLGTVQATATVGEQQPARVTVEMKAR